MPRQLSFFLTLLCLPTAVFAQATSFQVHVSDHPALTLTADDLAKMPQHTVRVTEHGKEISYSGVLIHDVLLKAGAPMDAQLKGKALSTYMLAIARDGYSVVYALPEFDAAFTDAQPLIANAADGKPLTEEQGPWRIVMPQDKKPARSLRMLQQIEVVQLLK